MATEPIPGEDSISPRIWKLPTGRSFSQLTVHMQIIAQEASSPSTVVSSSASSVSASSNTPANTDEITFDGNPYIGATPYLVCLVDAQDGLHFLSPAFEFLLGEKEEVRLFRSFLDFIHPDDHAEAANELSRLRNGEPPRTFVLKLRTPSGSFCRLEWIGHLDDASNLICLTASEFDEEADGSNTDVDSWLWMSDNMGRILFLSPGWYTLTQRTLEDSLGARWLSALHAEDARVLLTQWKQAFVYGEPFEGTWRIRNNDGQFISFAYTATPIKDGADKITNWVCMNQRLGIAALPPATAKPETDESRFETALALAKVCYWEWEVATDLVHVSDPLCDLLGILPKSFSSGMEDFLQYFVPEDRERMAAAFQNATTAGRISFSIEQPHGAPAAVYSEIAQERDEEGQLQRVTGVIHMAETTYEFKANVSDDRFERLAQTTPGVIFSCVLDEQGQPNFTYISPYSNEFLGLEPGAIQENAETLLSLFSAEDRTSFLSSLAASATQMQPWCWDGRAQIGGKDRWLHGTSQPVAGPNGAVFHGLLLDSTERKQLESQLVHSQKLASIGNLASGIAHEINTPIQYIKDNTAFLKDVFRDFKAVIGQYQAFVERGMARPLNREDFDQAAAALEEADIEYLNDEVPRAIEQSLDGIGHIARIVQAMKEFSHPSDKEKTLINLNQALETTVTIAKNEWKYVADIELKLDQGLPEIACHPGEINQAFLSLVIYSAHAISDTLEESSSERGRITIETRFDEEEVEVRISNTGKGIPDEVKGKIFDPLFTTGGVGKGTGQGLSIAYSVVVDKHQGAIQCESEVDVGTTFIIRLPRAATQN